MTVLALYTAGEPASVALLCGLHAVARELPGGRQLERIASAARELLDAAGVSARDVGRVAVAGGPGSFTGLRVGAAVALGFARATGAAVHAVPTPEVWAALALHETRPGDACVVALRARRGELHVASYSAPEERAGLAEVSLPRTIAPSRVLAVREALARIRPEDIVVGDGRAALREAGMPGLQPGFAEPPQPVAQPLARLAALQPDAAARPLGQLTLEYGRDPQAVAARGSGAALAEGRRRG